MDSALKHRLIGAAVLSALAIIFLPMLIVGRDKNDSAASVPLNVPGEPSGEFQTRELPLVMPASGVPDSGVVGMDASHPAAPSVAASPGVDANGLPLPGGAQPAPAASATPDAAASTASGIVNQEVQTAPSSPIASPAASNPASSVTASPAALPATAPVATPVPGVPIPAASAGGNYVVSLGTYSNAANAQSLVASLRKAQLTAYAEQVTVGGKAQTRVRIGPFAQRGDAEAARLKAQQVRSDMPTSVTALDAAAPAPVVSPPPAPAAPKPRVATPPAPAKPTATATPAPVAKPVAVAPPASSGSFAVQVSAYRSEDDALALRNKLRASGFTAFSEKVQAESGTMYRVRVGPEANREAAEKLRADLSAKMKLNGVVVGYP